VLRGKGTVGSLLFTAERTKKGRKKGEKLGNPGGSFLGGGKNKKKKKKRRKSLNLEKGGATFLFLQ